MPCHAMPWTLRLNAKCCFVCIPRSICNTNSQSRAGSHPGEGEQQYCIHRATLVRPHTLSSILRSALLGTSGRPLPLAIPGYDPRAVPEADLPPS